jgi:hypothetical protein
MEERKKIIPDKLEMSERELYVRGREPKQVTRHELHDSVSTIPSAWSGDNQMPTKKRKKHLMHSKNFRNLFMVAIAFFLGSMIFAFFTFFQGGTTISNNNIDIVVLGNSFVDGGEELPLQIKVANRNRTNIEIADMLVEYSKGVGGAEDIVRERVSLGEIKSGDIAEDIVEIAIFGEQGSVRDVTFTLEYRVENSNAIFVKEYGYQVTIATSPVDVIVEGPENVVSNQLFSTDITVIQNSTEVTENMMLVATYPSGFKFESATPEPDFGNDTWVLGDLAPGVEKTIQIQGSIRASNGEERIITIISGSQNPDDEQEIGVQFTATPLAIEIGTPFVSAELSTGQTKSNQFIVSSTGETTFTIDWENELDTSLASLEIIARFSGNGFDPTRVTVNQGFFDNNQGEIVWNQNNNSNLNNISPGKTGQLYFSLIPKAGVANPTISVAIDAKGVLVGQGTQPEEVSNIYNGVIRVASDVSISNALFFNNGPFVNSGTLPPKVGEETTYTVEWTVSSATSSLDDVKVVVDLPSYITWKGESFPEDANISYNSINRRLTWNAGEITPGASGSKKIYFKVGFIPSVSQIQTLPAIISSGSLEAKDAFTGDVVSKTFGQLNSSLSRDTEYNANNDRVVE